MESFLAALTPTLRANVQTVVDAYGEDALRMVVERYITEDGDWPTEPETASFLASQFLDNYGVIAGELEHYPPVFSGSGLKQATVAGLAGGALSVGSSKGATVLSSRLMGMYWKEMLGYAMGANPTVLTAVHRVFGMMTENTRWAQLAKDLSRPSSPFSDFGKTYQQLLERELLGILGRSAWRGARSAVTHYAGQIGPPSQASPWVQNYVHTFAQNQRTITERTMMQIINQGLERGLSERVLATDLRDYWTLTPKHAQAVENYRRGLAQQDRTVTSTRRLTRAYADRLTRSRVEAMSKTEVLTTFNLGREIQWKQAVQSGELPANTVKMWVTAQDELVCKICRPLDGMTAALGSPFETDRATLYAPTAHPNCRCLLIPVEDQTFPDISQNKQFIFARDLVEKHLIGRHDQKSHGRKDHGRNESIQAGLVGVAAVAMAGIGLFVLRGRGGAIRTLPMDTPVPTHLADDLTRMRNGRPPQDEVLTGGFLDLKGHTDDFVRSMQSGDLSPYARDMAELITKGHDLGPRYRGMPVTSRKVFNSFEEGREIVLGPSSFTSKPSVAQRFIRESPELSGATPTRPVMFEVRKSRGLDVDTWLRSEHAWEAESLIAGKFRIARVIDEEGVRRVILEQTELLDVGSSFRHVAKGSVEKRTVLIPEYEREDGTKVRRHTRVIGERDAADRWRDAPATKDHEKIAEFFNTYNFPEVPHSNILDVEQPSSYPKKPSPDDPDLRKKFSEWKTKVEGWWGTEDGKKYTWDLRAAENKWYSSVARDAIENAKASVDHEVLKSALFGSRIWTTQTDGVGLVRQLSGMTDYPTHRDVDLSSYRESKIRAASDFLNVVRNAPPIKKDLYRGIKISDEYRASLRDMKKTGGTLSLPVSSFTEDRHRGESFMGQYMIEEGYTPVLFTLKNSNALRLPNETSNRLYAESEFVTSGEFTIDEVELPTADDRAYRITISPVGVSKAKSRYGYIEDALCTPLPLPWRRTDVTKRTITIGEYLRGDGTRVEEHERRIGMKSVEEFLSNFERDGELSTHEAFTLGTIATLGLAIASRGRIRRRVTPSVYKDIRKTKDGFVPSEALRKNLMETFEFKGSQYSTRVNTIKIGDQPHHAMTADAIRESLGEGNRIARGFSRTFARRNNIRVEGTVVNRDGLRVGEFDIAIDPRRREAFQYGFYLNPGVQGKGFSGEFTAHLGKRYMETGIERVGALASGSVGGYAWAQRGFNWRYGPSLFVHDALEKAAKGQHRTIPTQPVEVAEEIARMHRRIRNGYVTRRFPTPKEVADIGRSRPFTHPNTGRETWAGREIMLDTQWHATMDLRQMQRLLRQEGVIKSYPMVAWPDPGVSETSEPVPGIKTTV